MPKKLKNLPLSPDLAPPEEIVVNNAKSASGIPAGWIIEPVAMRILHECCVMRSYPSDKKRNDAMTHYVRIEDEMSDEVLLERETYELVHEVLVRLGAKYVASSRVHAWPYDPSELLEILREEGTMPEKNPLEFFKSTPAVLEYFRWPIDPNSENRHPFAATCVNWHKEGFQRFRILDPSAGDGVLLDMAYELFGENADYFAVEISPYRRLQLRKKKYPLTILGEECGHNFLKMQRPADPDQRFSIILMNPPFGDVKHGNAAYIAHIYQALRFLRDRQSELYSVASAGFIHNEMQPYYDFYSFVITHGCVEELPRDIFKESDTMSATAFLQLGSEYTHYEDDPSHECDGYPNGYISTLCNYLNWESKFYDIRSDIMDQIVLGNLPMYSNGKIAPETREAIIKMYETFSKILRKEHQVYAPVRPQDHDALIQNVLEELAPEHPDYKHRVKRLSEYMEEQRVKECLNMQDQLTKALAKHAKLLIDIPRVQAEMTAQLKETEKTIANIGRQVEEMKAELEKQPKWEPPQRPEPPAAASLLDLFDELASAGV